ncbi:MAG: hypothetical protein WKF90_14310 [Pyrinomonadaceae bacterium]
MNKSKTFFAVAALFIFCLVNAVDSFAETENKPPQADPVYEVVFHTLVASNNAGGKTDVPQTLSPVIKKLKNNFSFNNYRVTTTYLERVANTGSVEFKSVAKVSVPSAPPIFSEWSLGGLRNLQNSKGQTSIHVQSFRFGQRVPIRTGINDNSVINYENIGLTLNRFGLPLGEPTVIGSLSTANEELMFLVLTINVVEN